MYVVPLGRVAASDFAVIDINGKGVHHKPVHYCSLSFVIVSVDFVGAV